VGRPERAPPFFVFHGRTVGLAPLDPPYDSDSKSNHEKNHPLTPPPVIHASLRRHCPCQRGRGPADTDNAAGPKQRSAKSPDRNLRQPRLARVASAAHGLARAGSPTKPLADAAISEQFRHANRRESNRSQRTLAASMPRRLLHAGLGNRPAVNRRRSLFNCSAGRQATAVRRTLGASWRPPFRFRRLGAGTVISGCFSPHGRRATNGATQHPLVALRSAL
jgi:hypothetical protein